MDMLPHMRGDHRQYSHRSKPRKEMGLDLVLVGLAQELEAQRQYHL